MTIPSVDGKSFILRNIPTGDIFVFLLPDNNCGKVEIHKICAVIPFALDDFHAWKSTRRNSKKCILTVSMIKQSAIIERLTGGKDPNPVVSIEVAIPKDIKFITLVEGGWLIAPLILGSDHIAIWDRCFRIASKRAADVEGESFTGDYQFAPFRSKHIQIDILPEIIDADDCEEGDTKFKVSAFNRFSGIAGKVAESGFRVLDGSYTVCIGIFMKEFLKVRRLRKSYEDFIINCAPLLGLYGKKHTSSIPTDVGRILASAADARIPVGSLSVASFHAAIIRRAEEQIDRKDDALPGVLKKLKGMNRSDAKNPACDLIYLDLMVDRAIRFPNTSFSFTTEDVDLCELWIRSPLRIKSDKSAIISSWISYPDKVSEDILNDVQLLLKGYGLSFEPIYECNIKSDFTGETVYSQGGLGGRPG